MDKLYYIRNVVTELYWTGVDFSEKRSEAKVYTDLSKALKIRKNLTREFEKTDVNRYVDGPTMEVISFI